MTPATTPAAILARRESPSFAADRARSIPIAARHAMQSCTHQ